jgi:hypothetical protein
LATRSAITKVDDPRCCRNPYSWIPAHPVPISEDIFMNNAIRLIAAALLMSSIGAHAGETTTGANDECSSLHGKMLNGLTLNGLTLNGLTFNGLTLNGAKLNDIKWNGLTLNTFRFNGPGLVLQGRTFNGLRFGQPIVGADQQAPISFRYADVRVGRG